jgi:ATP/maltotriose-dependent transcriptional regulator MalT
MWRGAWQEAESELSAATDELAASRPAMTGEGLARLGELRRRQGKLDEAIALFDRVAGHPIASLGRALTSFDRGDFKSAAELADRHLRRLPPQNRTERAAALELVVRAEIQLNNSVEVHKALDELTDIAARAQTDPLRASASVAAGLAAEASGDLTAARRHLEDAVDRYRGAPFEMARARIELARVLARTGRREAAADEARRAVEELAPLHADCEIARAADLLMSLEARPDSESTSRARTHNGASPAAADERGGLTQREIEVLRLISTGLSNQAIAERLFISEHTVHRHVANTLTKLNVPSRSAAVAQAARLGLLQ